MTTFEIEVKFFILAGLVLYRLSFLVTREEGPFSMFSQWRGRIDPNQSTWIGRGIRCPICISFWTSFLVAIVVFLQSSSLISFISVWFGLAGLATLLERISER